MPINWYSKKPPAGRFFYLLQFALVYAPVLQQYLSTNNEEGRGVAPTEKKV